MFTPTETRILRILSDGRPHKRAELMTCLWDELGDRTNLNFHLHTIRKKIRPNGDDIICELLNGRCIAYRYVILINDNRPPLTSTVSQLSATTAG